MRTFQNGFSVFYRISVLIFVFCQIQVAFGQNNRILGTISDANIKMKFALKEKFVSAFNQKISLGTKKPIICFAFQKGFGKDNLNSDYNYLKLGLSFEKRFEIRHLGKTNLKIEAAIALSDIPSYKFFAANGSYFEHEPYYVAQTFNTMGLYSFISDRYVNMYFSHNFGRLLINNRFTKPEIILIHNICVLQIL